MCVTCVIRLCLSSGDLVCNAKLVKSAFMTHIVCCLVILCVVLHWFCQGTEVKAITYSNMQIYNGENGKYEVFVIIDI